MKGKRPQEALIVGGRMDHIEIEWEGMGWIHLA
jgi:hypothetical protein